MAERRRAAGAALASLLWVAVAQAGPPIAQWTTSNGAKVLFLGADDPPMLDIRATFAAGSTRDGAQAGVARLTNGLLAEAAGGLDAQQLAERFERVGAQFSNGTLREMAWVSLRTLSDEQYLQPALDTFIKVLAHPQFRAEDLQRVRQQMHSALDQLEQSPDQLAERALFATLYRGHPYANPPDGEHATLDALSTADVEAFYRRYYVARNLTLAMVGALDRAAAERVAETITRELAGGERAAALPEPQPLQRAETVRVQFPSRQTHILIGGLGMARRDPQYFDLYMANHVFGGSGFSSRLLSTIRERHGLAYSAYSYFSPMQVRGPFILGVQTRNEQVEQTIAFAREELARYLKEGASEEELQASRDNVTGGFALRIDSNGKLLEYLTTIGYYELPLDYLDTFNDHVRAVTRDGMRRAMRERIDPEKLITVVVGG